MSAYERFWSKVDKGTDEECWLWHGTLDRRYGQFHLFGKDHRAHRLAYILEVGGIPRGLVVCHRCDNPICCNPSHLFVGTQAENIADMDRKGRRNHVSPKRRGRLSIKEVLALRNGTYHAQPYTVTAETLGVSPQTIQRVIDRITWRNLL